MQLRLRVLTQAVVNDKLLVLFVLRVATGVRAQFCKGVRMRLIKLFGFVFIFLFAMRLASAAKDPSEVLPTPILRSVDPDSIKAGEFATVLGENLDKSRVSELYLTNGTVDAKVHIVEQTSTTIKFKVPEKVVPGRYRMMVLLVGDPPRLIEEPARVTVVE